MIHPLWFGICSTLIFIITEDMSLWLIFFLHHYMGIIDTPPKIIKNRTMVPLRLVSESFGAQVEWIAETQEVIIRSPLN